MNKVRHVRKCCAENEYKYSKGNCDFLVKNAFSALNKAKNVSDLAKM